MLAAVFWDGGGEDLDWGNPENWSVDRLPAIADDVTIEAPDVTISHLDGQTELNSLVCSASLELLGGSLTVHGLSTVSGSLGISNQAFLMVSGPSAHFTAQGETIVSGAALGATDGGQLHLPAATLLPSNENPLEFMGAIGEGSLLSLPNVSILGADPAEPNGAMMIWAFDGGRVDLSGLSEISGAGIQFHCTGSGSTLDLSSLTDFHGSHYNGFTISGGGQLDLGEGTTHLRNARVNIDNGGMIVGGTIELLDNTLLSGNGVLAADVVNSARITTSGPAGLLIDGDYAQTTGGSLEIGLGEFIPGEHFGFSSLDVTGTASLKGDIEVQHDVGPGLPTGHRFELMAFGLREETFENIYLPSADLGRYWKSVYTTEPGNLSIVLTDDHQIPRVVGTGAEAIEEGGQPVGIAFGYRFNKELNPTTAAAAGNYRLIELDSGQDRSDLITSIEYTAAVDLPGFSTEPSVAVVVAPKSGLPRGRYQLTMLGGNVLDMAGNSILTGDTSIRFNFAVAPPVVLQQSDGHRARAVVPPGSQSAASIVLQLSDNDLIADQATGAKNYRLERLDDGGSVVGVHPITSVSYDRYADRIMLGGFGVLPAGDYRLTMFTEADPLVPGSSGIANLAGMAIDGDEDGTAGGLFVEEFAVSPGRLSGGLDEEMLGGAFQSLDGLLGQSLIPLAEESREMFAGEAFAEQMLEQLRLEFESPRGDSQTMAERINTRIGELFAEAREAYEALNPDGNFLPYGEFIVVWGHDVRFLLQTPDTPGDHGAVGFDESGNRIETIGGALLLDDGNGSQGISLAIVPVDLAGKVLSNELVTTERQNDLSPDLYYRIELQGIEETNQAGIVTFRSEGLSGSRVFADTSTAGIVEGLDFSNYLSGLDPIVAMANEVLLERVAEATGPLAALTENMLILWFDPVDFVLADAQGQTSSHTQSSSYDQAAGSFYQGSGLTEMLVIPNANSGVYTLELVGVGGNYRGAVNFMENGYLRTAHFQGNLGTSENLVVQIDFRTVLPVDPVDPGGLGGITGLLGDLSPSSQASAAMSAISQAGMFAIAGGMAVSSAISGNSTSNFGDTSTASGNSYGTGGGAEDGDQQTAATGHIAVAIAAVFDNFYDLFGDFYESLGLLQRIKQLVPGGETFFDSLENILSGRGGDEDLKTDSVDGSPSVEDSNDSPRGTTIGGKDRESTDEKDVATATQDSPTEKTGQTNAENDPQDISDDTAKAPAPVPGGNYGGNEGANSGVDRLALVDEILGTPGDIPYAKLAEKAIEEIDLSREGFAVAAFRDE